MPAKQNTNVPALPRIEREELKPKQFVARIVEMRLDEYPVKVTVEADTSRIEPSP
jgi:hypothetical protein